MENVWHLFNNTPNTSGGRGQNSHSTPNPHHHAWELGNSPQPYNFHDASTPTAATATPTTTQYYQEGALMFPHHHELPSSSSSNGSKYYHMDSHLTCLKLGKRHYFENANNNNNNTTNNNNDNNNDSSNDIEAINRLQEPGVIKKVKNFIDGQEQICGGVVGGCGGLIWQPPSPPTTPTAVAPQCQVEGCNVMLVNAKDYHKRHKVCEMHSKAPKVIVLGIEQRFCQQCSRFHAVSEFDESKRSCRRRLAGHNERRRKSSQEQPSQRTLILSSDKVMAGGGVGGGGGCGYLPLLGSGGALSLMSSNNYNFSPDLSAQSSAALRELMVENRAHSWRNHHMEDQSHRVNYFPATETACWEDMNAGAHLSLERRPYG